METPPRTQRLQREATSSVKKRATKKRDEEECEPITVTVGGECGKSLYEQIAELKEEQKKAQEEKKRVARELRNASRRKGRVMRKARELNNRDLAEVITMRQEVAKAKQIKAEQEEGDARAAAAAASAADSEPAE
jgi:hypothetical protein